MAMKSTGGTSTTRHVGKQIWVSPEKGKWKVHLAGANNSTDQYFEKRDTALQIAKRRAQQNNYDLVIQNKRGQISRHGRP